MNTVTLATWLKPPHHTPALPVTAAAAPQATPTVALVDDVVPGARGCPPPDAPFQYAGAEWTPLDARCMGGMPIGLSLALELSGTIVQNGQTP